MIPRILFPHPSRRASRFGKAVVGRISVPILIAVLTVTLSGQAAAPKAGKAMPSEAAATHRLALLIGIDRYPSQAISDLAGSVNDVENMKRLLVDTFAFPEDDEHILTLTNEQATRDHILRAIEQHLIAKAGRDSIVVLHYSGHGSYKRDASGDEIDGLDETVVPYDSGREPDENRDILDDELNQLMARLTAKTPNVTVILDSCHSGSATRGSGRARTAAPDLRPVAGRPEPRPDATRSAREGRSDLRPANSSYALISAAAAGELARELTVGGKTYGALTWHLADEVRRAATSKAELTYRDIMDTVKAKVTARYPSQHPQLEGRGAERYVFSDHSQKSAPYLLARLAVGGRIALAAGQVHGVTEGSVYELYAPGTRDFGPETPVLARVRVERVEIAESRARFIDGRLSDPAAVYRAVEREHRFPDNAVRLFMRGLDRSPTLGQVRSELAAYHHVAVVEEAAAYDLLLAEEDGFILTEGGEPSEISPRVPVDDPAAVSRVIDQITHWAKWLNLLHLANQSNELGVELAVRTSGPPNRTRGTSTMEREIDLTLVDGQLFAIDVRNTSQSNLYTALLDLSSDGSISLLYPLTTSDEFIAPGKTWSIELKAYLPEGSDVVRDVLKLIVTSTPCDFRFLQQSPVTAGGRTTRGGRANPLEELLTQTTLGTTRGGISTEVEVWSTVERVLEVRRP